MQESFNELIAAFRLSLTSAQKALQNRKNLLSAAVEDKDELTFYLSRDIPDKYSKIAIPQSEFHYSMDKNITYLSFDFNFELIHKAPFSDRYCLKIMPDNYLKVNSEIENTGHMKVVFENKYSHGPEIFVDSTPLPTDFFNNDFADNDLYKKNLGSIFNKILAKLLCFLSKGQYSLTLKQSGYIKEVLQYST